MIGAVRVSARDDLLDHRERVPDQEQVQVQRDDLLDHRERVPDQD